MVYCAFDLLWRNGDFRKLPQLQRKQLLLGLLACDVVIVAVEVPGVAGLASAHAGVPGGAGFGAVPEVNVGLFVRLDDVVVGIGLDRALGRRSV